MWILYIYRAQTRYDYGLNWSEINYAVFKDYSLSSLKMWLKVSILCARLPGTQFEIPVQVFETSVQQQQQQHTWHNQILVAQQSLRNTTGKTKDKYCFLTTNCYLILVNMCTHQILSSCGVVFKIVNTLIPNFDLVYTYMYIFTTMERFQCKSRCCLSSYYLPLLACFVFPDLNSQTRRHSSTYANICFCSLERHQSNNTITTAYYFVYTSSCVKLPIDAQASKISFYVNIRFTCLFTCQLA
eukprot:TRINITY_DN771_c3_g1_i5.p2 TRINITY_DN771_c3_g1~~TRINITY_DN771_c3_g1_i5.p2  ORF type:complete len:242 (+),score=-19.74 TRINITY_DN771_c3_g1_i5:701-1426(+)